MNEAVALEKAPEAEGMSFVCALYNLYSYIFG